MNFSFTSPWYLLGLLGLALPILIHLLTRRQQTRLKFSAVYLLQQAKKRSVRKSRPNKLLLLLLRCLAIGFLGSIVETRQVFSAEMRMLLFIGFLGGFTTFSTFGFETFSLLRDQQYVSAISNILLHIIVGIVAVWLGFILARFVFGE